MINRLGVSFRAIWTVRRLALAALVLFAVPGYLISSVALERLRLRGRIPTQLMQKVQLIHWPERWLETRSSTWSIVAKRECMLIDDLIFETNADYCQKPSQNRDAAKVSN